MCDPANPADVKMQEPSVHAFDARTGAIRWQAAGASSFAATTTAGGMTFNGLAFTAEELAYIRSDEPLYADGNISDFVARLKRQYAKSGSALDYEKWIWQSWLIAGPAQRM